MSYDYDDDGDEDDDHDDDDDDEDNDDDDDEDDDDNDDDDDDAIGTGPDRGGTPSTEWRGPASRGARFWVLWNPESGYLKSISLGDRKRKGKKK